MKIFNIHWIFNNKILNQVSALSFLFSLLILFLRIIVAVRNDYNVHTEENATFNFSLAESKVCRGEYFVKP